MSNKIKYVKCQKYTFIKSYYRLHYYCGNLLENLDDGEKNVLYELCKNNNLIIDVEISDNCYLFVGNYYRLNKNYEFANKYYLIAIEKGNAVAMNNLGHYYEIHEKNYELAKKYYSMAIKKGNVSARKNLCDYYETNEKNYRLAKKYCLMAFLNGDYNSSAIESINQNFGKYFKKIRKLGKLAKLKNKNLKQVMIELKYASGGIGYLDTKKHFESLINK